MMTRRMLSTFVISIFASICLPGCLFPAYHVLYKPMTPIGRKLTCTPCGGTVGYILNNNCLLEIADKGYTLELKLLSSNVEQTELYFYLEPKNVSASGDLTKLKMRTPNSQVEYPSKILLRKYGKTHDESDYYITGKTEFCSDCFYLIQFKGGITTGQQAIIQFDEADLEVDKTHVSLEDIPILKKRVLDIFLLSGINC